MSAPSERDREMAASASFAEYLEPYQFTEFEALLAQARSEGFRAGIEAAAKVADDAYAQWKKNADRPQSEHSGPSYAAAVAGEAASRDIAAAIRALLPRFGGDDARKP